MAKPIVDILMEVADGASMDAVSRRIEASGWLRMSETKDRISLNRGYTENGFAEKVYHLHLRRRGDADEIAFRDYMVSHPSAAREYEALKLSLWKTYEHDRDGYTEAKSEFVRRYTNVAKSKGTVWCRAGH